MVINKRMLNGLVNASKNKYAGNIDTCEVYKRKYHVDTGNYILNFFTGCDIYSGIPSGMIVQWAGKESTGKSFLTSNQMIHHVKSNKNHIALLLETEGTFASEAIKKVLSPDEIERFNLFPCKTVEDIKIQLNNMLEYIKANLENWKDAKVLVTIDSIGMPPSKKEATDATNEKASVDMTRAREVKSLFRTITMDLAILNIPLNLVNHQYASMSAFEGMKESSGTGVAYSNSVTFVLRKAKMKEGDEVVGTEFIITTKKHRDIRENAKFSFFSKFINGTDRYSGLWEFLKDHKLMTSKAVGGGKKGSIITIPDLNV